MPADLAHRFPARLAKLQRDCDAETSVTDDFGLTADTFMTNRNIWTSNL